MSKRDDMKAYKCLYVQCKIEGLAQEHEKRMEMTRCYLLQTVKTTEYLRNQNYVFSIEHEVYENKIGIQNYMI